MKKVVVTDRALRELIAETLDSSAYVPEPDLVNVNDVVDPSAADTDPSDPNYKPQNSTELGVAIKRMTTGMDSEQAPRVFDVLKGALDDKKDDEDPSDPDGHDQRNEKDKQDMNEPKGTTSTTGSKTGTRSGTHATEAFLREVVRSNLSTIPLNLLYLVEDYQEPNSYDRAVGSIDDEDPTFEDEFDPEPTMLSDDEFNFSDIAKELGLGVSGAKQFVDKARARFRFLSKELPMGPNLEKGQKDKREEADKMILQAYTDYVEKLKSTGELTPDDVQLLQDYPHMALELDGFREFLHHYIRASMQGGFENLDGTPWAGITGKNGEVSTHYQHSPAFKPSYDSFMPFDSDEEGNAVYDFDDNEKEHRRTVDKATSAVKLDAVDIKKRPKHDLQAYTDPATRAAALKAAEEKRDKPVASQRK
jgi:hypothetical protein